MINPFKWEYDFRTTVLALVSLCVSVGFAVMNGVIAVRERMIWYCALAVYYTLLIIFRVAAIGVSFVAKRKCKDAAVYERTQYRIYLGCGAFLVLIELAMCFAVAQMVMYGKPMRGGMIFAIANAAYVFYKLSMSTVNVFKAKNKADPVSQALRNLSFTEACMSMVSLTVLMLYTFGTGESSSFFTAMKACVGFAACAVVLYIATFMIVKSAKKLKEADSDERREDDRE